MHNQKGFAVTGVLYGVLILFLTMLSLILFDLQGKKTILDKQKKDVYNRLEGIEETIERIPIGQTWDFDYTGNVQTFTVPATGNYKVELWGAAGGTGSYSTMEGKGGYTAGTISLNTSERLYVYVGNNYRDGNLNNSTFNGGGPGEAIGGGATDVRLTNGDWDNFNSLKSRIMVAAGGGGGFHTGNTSNWTIGAAGGLSGYNANAFYTETNVYLYPDYSGSGATQVSGGSTGSNTMAAVSAFASAGYNYVLTNANGSFGKGGYSESGWSSGGGGGYYGGGHGLHPGDSWSGGGGGSSFISGYNGCNAISESSTSSNIVHTNQPNHYSGKVFTDGVMIDGKGCNWSTGSAANCGSNQPQPNGTNSTGHSGNGYARITYLG